MLKLITAKAYLARAETSIVIEQDRISQQAARVEHLRSTGQDPQAAMRRHAQMVQSLECWQHHRGQLLDGIASRETEDRG